MTGWRRKRQTLKRVAELGLAIGTYEVQLALALVVELSADQRGRRLGN